MSMIMLIFYLETDTPVDDHSFGVLRNRDIKHTGTKVILKFEIFQKYLSLQFLYPFFVSHMM